MSDSEDYPKSKKNKKLKSKKITDYRTKNKGRPKKKILSDIENQTTPESSDTEPEPKPKKEKTKHKKNESDEKFNIKKQIREAFNETMSEMNYGQQHFAPAVPPQNYMSQPPSPKIVPQMPPQFHDQKYSPVPEKKEDIIKLCKKHTCIYCNDAEIIDPQDIIKLRKAVLERIVKLVKTIEDPNLIDQNTQLRAQTLEILMRTVTTYT